MTVNEKAVSLKHCNTCNLDKPLSEFKTYGNGRGQMYTRPRCNECRRADHRSEHSRKMAREKQRRYRGEGRLKEIDLNHAHSRRARHPEKLAASAKLRSAVRWGKIVRPTSCERAIGIKSHSSRSLIGTKRSGWKKKLNGGWVRRDAEHTRIER